MRSKRKTAFTLIELLVVIAIIAILAAILFPVFAKAREKARQSSCLSNTKQMGLGIMQYCQDYDETFPGGGGMGFNSAWNPAWWQEIEPYVKGSQIFTCPSATGYANATGTNYPVTYGCNRNLMKWASGAKLASVVAPAERIIIAEHNGTDWCAYASNETNPPNIYMTVNNTINPRHLGGSNLIFCDGHAKWFIAGGDVNPTNLW